MPNIPPPYFALHREPHKKSAFCFPHWIEVPFRSVTHSSFHNYAEWPWRPFVPLQSDLQFYTTYVELCNRIAYLHSIVKNSESPDKQHIYEELDKYVLLSIYMERTGMFLDFDLTDAPIIVYPSSKLVFSTDCLPTIQIHAIYALFLRQHKQTPFLNPCDQQFIRMLSKALPISGNKRGNATMNSEFLQSTNSYVRDGLSRLIAAGLLGIYDQCKEPAEFHVRRKIYEWFYFNDTTDALKNWFFQNPEILLYVIREALFSTVHSNSIVYELMCSVYRWELLESNIFNTMDRIRSRLSQMRVLSDFTVGVSADNSTFLMITEPRKDTIESAISIASSKNLKNAPKIIRCQFELMTYKLMKKQEKSKFTRHKVMPWSCPAVSRITNTLLSLGRTVNDPPLEIPLDYLILFGTSRKKCLDPLEKCRQLYENETNTIALTDFIKNLRNEYPEFYVRLFAHYDTLHYINAFQLSPLPYHIAKKQVIALRKEFAFTSNEPLPVQAGNVLACQYCGLVKSDIKFDRVRRGKESKVPVYNLLTYGLFCKRIVPRSHSNPKTVVTRDRPKCDGCKFTELISVNLIGKVLYSRQQLSVILCPGCCRLMVLCNEAYDTLGRLHCGCIPGATFLGRECEACYIPTPPIRGIIVCDEKYRMTVAYYCSKHKLKFAQTDSRFLRKNEVKRISENKEFKTCRSDGYVIRLPNNNPLLIRNVWEKQN